MYSTVSPLRVTSRACRIGAEGRGGAIGDWAGGIRVEIIVGCDEKFDHFLLMAATITHANKGSGCHLAIALASLSYR